MVNYTLKLQCQHYHHSLREERVGDCDFDEVERGDDCDFDEEERGGDCVFDNDSIDVCFRSKFLNATKRHSSCVLIIIFEN